MDKQTVPLGNTFGWKSGGVNLPVKTEQDVERMLPPSAFAASWIMKLASWYTCVMVLTFRRFGRIFFGKHHLQCVHSSSPGRLDMSDGQRTSAR